ncbi:GIY-YIG nuclease family protein [Streptomyces sp. NPDC005395]|uniref:GIY-YIG nuclease family protein n=1 Tax=Streptomyces sp. NPDC005395 TaxID=3157042 RepID=UPI0033BF2E3B
MTETGKLTGGQIAVLIAATVPMAGFGGLGAWGTFTNIVTEFDRAATAIGVVAAGEGVTLVLALVMVALTMLGQAAPWPVRAGLWSAPAAAAMVGVVVADGLTEAVVYGITPMAMCASAEGLGLVARRIVVYRKQVDVEAQRRNARTMRRIAYHRARSVRHPWKWARKWSELVAWRLMRQAGEGDVELGVELIRVQRVKLSDGAGQALGDMLAVDGPSLPELPAADEPAPAPRLPPAPVPAPQRAPKSQPPSKPAGPVGEVVEDIASLLGKAHAPIVYFIRNGSRVKIGVTQNLARRVRAISLRSSDVIRIEHGHNAYETMLHFRFSELRVGDTEWFELRDELAEYLGLADAVTQAIPTGEPGTSTDEPERNEPDPSHEKAAPEERLDARPAVTPEDQHKSSDAGASQAQPDGKPVREQPAGLAPAAVPSNETSQILDLASKLLSGEQITKKTAAPLLGVSPATAQRRLTQAHRVVKLAEWLKAGERLTPATAAPLLGVDERTAELRLNEARVLNGEGTGFYA